MRAGWAPYPPFIAHGEGCRVWDVDGHEYIDLLNGFGANFLGYQPAFIRRALVQQVEAGFEIGPQHPLTGEVAALIRELTGVERVAFCNTGSEAVMLALRLARAQAACQAIKAITDIHGISGSNHHKPEQRNYQHADLQLVYTRQINTMDP